MNVTCPHCKIKLNLPEDKIPRHRDASFRCPKCREMVPVKAAGDAPGPTGAAPALPDTGSTRPKSAGRDAALVCMLPSALKKLMLAAVRDTGFAAEAPETKSQALKLLEYRAFPLMIIEDAFDNNAEVGQYMNEMDMSLRRRICLVRISPDVTTGDPMAALHSSVNHVINARDLEQTSVGSILAPGLLAAALEDHENRYAVFNDSLKRAGKA
ncbi:MAG: zinc-ribbon domain-containing protein [Desulfobacter sp.]